jgi:hypothetical protein
LPLTMKESKVLPILISNFFISGRSMSSSSSIASSNASLGMRLVPSVSGWAANGSTWGLSGREGDQSSALTTSIKHLALVVASVVTGITGWFRCLIEVKRHLLDNVIRRLIITAIQLSIT